MQTLDSYGRPGSANRPPPPLHTNTLPPVNLLPSIPSQGYPGTYRGSMGIVGVSEYGSQPPPPLFYGSSSGPQSHNATSRLVGSANSGYASPGSSERSRPPSTEIREGTDELSPTAGPGTLSRTHSGLSGTHESHTFSSFYPRR
jgi:hypothetical protein